MNILVTNNTLNSLGGSETYAYTLLKELNRREGISADGFSKQLGNVSNILKSEGVMVSDIALNMYDAVFASHSSTIQYIKNFNGTKIQTCHGVYPALEQPVQGMDKHVAISKEVQDHLTSLGFDSTVIHNGVDCNRFKPVKKLNASLRTVLSLSQSTELNSVLGAICNQIGVKLITLNKFVNPVFNVEDYINEADLVVSLGRGCYEAMACGREVLVLDKRPYVRERGFIGDGLVSENNINDILSHNCSGRHTNFEFNYNNILDTLLLYNHNNGDFNREFALRELNIAKQVDKYLDLI